MDLPALTFDPAPWGPRVEGHLHRIDGIGRHLDGIAARVLAEEYQALLIHLDGRDVGALVWSIEQDDRGPVIVVNALAAEPIRGLDVTRLALDLIAQAGRIIGAVAVRFWTEREGLKRKMERAGFRSSYVLEGAL